MADELMIECYECEIEGTEFDAIEVEGNLYCKSCYEDKFTKCNDCHNIVDISEVHTYYANEICEQCYQDNYSYCTACSGMYHNDDTTCSENGDIYCHDCYNDRYIICASCSEETRINNSRSNDSGTDYCEDCYWDRYIICSGCDGEVGREDSRYDSNDGEYYCEDCYEDHYGGSNNNLRCYSYKPRPEFFGKNGIHLGVELEVEGSYDDISEEVDHTHLYYKSDGSLDDGFEIVSHPMTYKYMKDKEVFANVLKICRRENYKSHNTSTCGMHIHVSKSIFSSLHLYKTMRLVYENESLFLALAQRKKNQADQWASFQDNNPRSLRQYAKEKYKSSRYEAINISTEKTVEFRFMKGNLITERFYKNVELVLSIIEFCQNASMANINKDSYLKYVLKNEKEYKNLAEFCKLKEIGYVKQLPVVV